MSKGRFFFGRPAVCDEKTRNKKWTEEAVGILQEFIGKLDGITDFSAANVKTELSELINSKGVKFGKVLPALRLALTGAGAGPDLMQIMEIFGKDETVGRLNDAFENSAK